MAISFDSAVVRNLALEPLEWSVANFANRWRRTAPAQSGLLALMVTDLESFTSWVSQLGDDEGLSWIRAHNRLVRDAIQRAGGSEVAHTGDGMIAAFRSMTAALRCSQKIQRSLADYSRDRPQAPLRARIGVHAGEPLPEDGRLFGRCVNTTVRVCDRAGAGQVLVTEVVRQLTQGHAFEFLPRSADTLKGVPGDLMLHELITGAQVAGPTELA